MILRKISLLLILVSIWGCSTKKNTWLSRNYHNLTAYYNVYFNGREAFKNGDKAIIESYENDYSNVLPVFEASDPDVASTADADMDRAIEKGQKLIKKHSITVKPKKRSRKNAYATEFYNKKEFNAWVDDAYVLMGKARVYKHEHGLAIRTLQQVIRDFPDSESMYEALIWQARAYTNSGDYIGALAALESYDLGGNAPLNLYAEYMATYANLLIVQQKYTEAIVYMKNAATDEKRKHQRLRYNYILGQLYLINDQRQEAAEAFGYVAKSSTDYEMTFNAKVNQASIIYQNADIAEVKKQLHKLRKEKKNKDYLDRIYFAFGRVALQENNEPEALRNFKKSVNYSIDNNNQKGLSYRAAGEIYYDQMDYANAYFYYDSALTVINEDYERIDELKERHYGLSGLIDHLLTVQREDSLQRLADMSEPVLYAYLDDIIAQKEEEQQRLAKQQEEEQLDDAFFYQDSRSANNFGQTGKWYFYNQTSMGLGKMEFEKRWGKRKLEDNWRRKDKSTMAEEVNDDDPFDLPDDPFADASKEKKESKETAVQGNEDNNKTSVDIPTREQLLADIPLSPEMRKESDEKIEAALLEQGFVFMDRLENYPKAIEALEDLLARYPNAQSRDVALIALHNAYRLNNDEDGMLATKNRIEREFPDHRFVEYLNDPEFATKLLAKKSAQEKAYESTYEEFLFGRFENVIHQSSTAINAVDKDENKLINKYLLLRGLSYAKTGMSDPFSSDMETIIANDEQGEEAVLAQSLLEQLREGKTPVQGTLYASAPGIKTSTESSSPDAELGLEQIADFVYVDDEAYELIVMDILAEDMNRAIYNVANYNFSRYLLHDFEIKEIRLLDGSPALTVSGFANRVEAMDYFYGLRENPDFFNFRLFTDNIVVLSESNYNKFYLSGLVNDYKEFFAKYYLQHVEAEELDKVKGQASTNEVEVKEKLRVPKDILNKETDETPKEEQPVSDTNTTNLVSQPGETSKATQQTEVVEEKPQTTPIVETPVVEKEETKTAIAAETAVTEQTEPEKEASIFELNKEAAHNVYVIIKKTRIDYKKIQKLYQAHARNNIGSDAKVSLNDYGASYKMLQIESFSNAADALKFIDSVKKAQHLMRDIKTREHYIWAVTTENFAKIKNGEKMAEYEAFYNANY